MATLDIPAAEAISEAAVLSTATVEVVSTTVAQIATSSLEHVQLADPVRKMSARQRDINGNGKTTQVEPGCYVNRDLVS